MRAGGCHAVKCYFHPEEEALYECTSCGKPICGDCMQFTDDDEVRCPECTLESALRLSMQDEIEWEKRRDRQRRRSLAIPGDHGRIINPFLAILFVVLLVANWVTNGYLSTSNPEINLSDNAFLKANNPAAEVVFLGAKLLRYAEDRNGQFPEALTDLYPDYIDKYPYILNSRMEYAYRTDPKRGFILSLPSPANYGFKKLTITANGVLELE